MIDCRLLVCFLVFHFRPKLATLFLLILFRFSVNGFSFTTPFTLLVSQLSIYVKSKVMTKNVYFFRFYSVYWDWIHEYLD